MRGLFVSGQHNLPSDSLGEALALLALAKVIAGGDEHGEVVLNEAAARGLDFLLGQAQALVVGAMEKVGS